MTAKSKTFIEIGRNTFRRLTRQGHITLRGISVPSHVRVNHRPNVSAPSKTGKTQNSVRVRVSKMEMTDRKGIRNISLEVV